MQKIFKYLIGIVFMAILFALLWWSSDLEAKNQGVYKNPFATPTPQIIELNAEKLMSIVNAWRYSQGFQPYINNENLCTLSSQRAVEIKKDFSHEGFSSRIKNQSFGFKYNKLAENLIKGYLDEQTVLNAWLKSPEHRENLNYSYRYSCIQCSETYCVQTFANF